MEPSACVHCLPVSLVKPSASCLAVMPVSADLYGNAGLHQQSVATLLTSEPSASASLGNSSTLATVASLGRYPCWAACFQNVLKSGGSGVVVNSSALPFLKVAIGALKSLMPSWYAPASTIEYPAFCMAGGNPSRNALA